MSTFDPLRSNPPDFSCIEYNNSFVDFVLSLHCSCETRESMADGSWIVNVR